MRPFPPSPRQINLLILLGFSALGAALYLRNALLDADALAAACFAGAPRAACTARAVLAELSEMQLFGGVALIAAVLHFARPRLAAFAVALAAAILGLFLGNAGAAAFAAAFLVMAFARVPPAGRRAPAPGAPPPATTPASSRTIH